MPRTSIPSGFNWFGREFVNRLDRRFRRVSAARMHTTERLEFGGEPDDLGTEGNVDTAVFSSIYSVRTVCNGILRFEDRGRLRISKAGLATNPPSFPDFFVFHRALAGERVICVFENKNVRKSIHESYNFHLSGDRDGKGKNWVLVMQQACKYVDTRKTRRFILCDYVYWAFVEIDRVDTVTHEFD